MSPERWETIKGMVKDKFEVLSERREQIPDDHPGTQEVIEFVTPAGRMLLEWTDEPLKLNTRSLGSKRIGSSHTVVHEYSESERVHRFTVYRWDDIVSDWVEVRGEPGSFSATF